FALLVSVERILDRAGQVAEPVVLRCVVQETVERWGRRVVPVPARHEAVPIELDYISHMDRVLGQRVRAHRLSTPPQDISLPVGDGVNMEVVTGVVWLHRPEVPTLVNLDGAVQAAVGRLVSVSLDRDMPLK